MTNPLLYSINDYHYIASAMLHSGHLDAGRMSQKTFPDGEEYLRIEDDVRGRSVIVLGGTINDRATLAIYDLACAVVKSGASHLTLAIPYYGYATMERAILPGEVVKAKTRARLLSSIPIASQGNDAVLIDLHSEGIPHYFEGAMTARHVYATPVVLELIKSLGGDDFVLAATDAGRAKWVQSYANVLGVSPAFIIKRRKSATETVVEAVNAQVEGRRVVIYDDMIRSGGSLVAAANAYREAGAIDVRAVCSHGVFVENTLERLQQDGAISKVACTDTHPRAIQASERGVMIGSIADTLLNAVLPAK